MKSNFVIPLVVFLSVCLGIGGSVASHGVADLEKQDSTISVIAYFCKNDTMKYVRTKTSFTVDVADTSAVDTAYCEEFMIIVRDSTADGNFTLSEGDHGYLIYNYKLEWQDRMYVRPIPDTAFTLNPELGQNYGWDE